jgi:hypothetical protein
MKRSVYIRRLLDLYTGLPDTPDRSNLQDQRLAAELYDKNIDLHTLESAFLLGIARRRLRPHAAPPLQPVRSLHFFLPILQEITDHEPDPQYLSYLADRLYATYGITFPTLDDVNTSQWRPTRYSPE